LRPEACGWLESAQLIFEPEGGSHQYRKCGRYETGGSWKLEAVAGVEAPIASPAKMAMAAMAGLRREDIVDSDLESEAWLV